MDFLFFSLLSVSMWLGAGVYVLHKHQSNKKALLDEFAGDDGAGYAFRSGLVIFNAMVLWPLTLYYFMSNDDEANESNEAVNK